MLQYASVLGLLLFGPLVTHSPSGRIDGSADDVPETVSSSDRAVSGEAGIKVAVDPVTGEIITQPTEADLAILAEGVQRVHRRSPWELRSFRLAHGGEGVFLDGWADQALEVKVDADGQISTTCGVAHDHDTEGGERRRGSTGEENLR